MKNGEAFKCKLCGKILKREKGSLRNVARHHKTQHSAKKLVACLKCSHVSINEFALYKHFVAKHGKMK